MTHIHQETIVDAPHSIVWNILADMGGVMLYNPFVCDSYMVTEADSGIGATRVCEFGDDFATQESCCKWIEGHIITVDMETIKGEEPPFGNMQLCVTLEAIAADKTHIAFNLTYDTKLGAIGALMEADGLRDQYEAVIQGAAIGFKHYVETGDVPDMAMVEREIAQSA